MSEILVRHFPNGKNPLVKIGGVTHEIADKASNIKQLHDTVRARIVRMNKKVKQRVDCRRRFVKFEPGDLVWVHFRKERFPLKRRSKLSPRSDGPFKILEQINDNAYKVDLPGEYEDEDGIPSLRANFSQAEEDDDDRVIIHDNNHNSRGILVGFMAKSESFKVSCLGFDLVCSNIALPLILVVAFVELLKVGTRGHGSS
ncbi:hypothetical protein L1987_83203 [Smallanthus sonchifolius]|uniref:Uncharacterized protein n=1 Tax=Smallanthus sonchifolius TaxID=185202 RepID=A0ACB8YCM1_9ASTR|nr:hypothetical protein L1987_83203 [Smallanthus sonchifolius]